jgi:hypothetical protein
MGDLESVLKELSTKADKIITDNFNLVYRHLLMMGYMYLSDRITSSQLLDSLVIWRVGRFSLDTPNLSVTTWPDAQFILKHQYAEWVIKGSLGMFGIEIYFYLTEESERVQLYSDAEAQVNSFWARLERLEKVVKALTAKED